MIMLAALFRSYIQQHCVIQHGRPGYGHLIKRMTSIADHFRNASGNVVLDTGMGQIVVELYWDHAPKVDTILAGSLA